MSAQGHDANAYGVRKVAVSRRVGRSASPAPTVDAGGFAPGNDAPLIAGERPRGSDEYAKSLNERLPKIAPVSVGLRLASLFCGCGGIDLGFRSAGFELAFASDYSARAAETFAANLGHRPVVRDVREVRASDIPAGVNVLTGGFPCVSFSTAGRRLGVEDTLNGKLYLELCRLIGEVRPPYFVAENVRGILSANGGAAVKLVLAAFLRLGYRAEYRLVNMAEHGVPQTRERVIFIGVRLDRWRGSFRFPEKTHRLRGDRSANALLLPAVSLRRAIGDLGDPCRRRAAGTGGENAYVVRAASEGRQISEREPQELRSADEPCAVPTSVHPPHVVEEIRAVTHEGGATHAALGRPPTAGYGYSRPRGGDDPSHSQATSPNVLHVRARPVGEVTASEPREVHSRSNHEVNDAPRVPSFNTTTRIARSTRSAPTVCSGNDGGGALNSQPFIDGMRRMTVRECARVQTFPDWFEFRGSQADGYRQVGNAVPPLYARLLAEAILEYESRR